MKKYIKIIAVICLLNTFQSCSEEQVLELSPVNNISIDDAFSTPNLILASMNGVYNAAQVGQYNLLPPNSGRGYLWGAAFVQQGDMRGEDGVATIGFYDLTYSTNYDAAGSFNNIYYWIDGYRLINRCNLMIEGVNTAVAKGIINQATADNYIGQARFLRGITHFELLNYFARQYNFTADASHLGIPYREVGVDTEAEIATETLKGRNTVAECYTKVIADLNAAETLIPSTNTAKDKVTRGAAIAFKTRVYLQQRDWAKVLTEGAKIIGSYSLTSTPVGPFANNLSNTETIFSISHSAAVNPGANGALAQMYKGRLAIAISPIIWRDPSWLADDKRREEGVMVFTTTGVKYTNKYRDVTNNTDAAPVIRYAEVLLNMAEANARISAANLPAALSLLNQVRNRSLATPATQAYTSASFTTQADMVNAILKERRIEFVLEGRRWSDIHRLQNDDIAPINGIPAKLGGASYPPASAYTLGTPYTGPLTNTAKLSTDFRFLWPIPTLETNVNPTLAAQQNPGW